MGVRDGERKERAWLKGWSKRKGHWNTLYSFLISQEFSHGQSLNQLRVPNFFSTIAKEIFFRYEKTPFSQHCNDLKIRVIRWATAISYIKLERGIKKFALMNFLKTKLWRITNKFLVSELFHLQFPSGKHLNLNKSVQLTKQLLKRSNYESTIFLAL